MVLGFSFQSFNSQPFRFYEVLLGHFVWLITNHFSNFTPIKSLNRHVHYTRANLNNDLLTSFLGTSLSKFDNLIMFNSLLPLIELIYDSSICYNHQQHGSFCVTWELGKLVCIFSPFEFELTFLYQKHSRFLHRETQPFKLWYYSWQHINESKLLHTYVMNEFLAASCSRLTKYF